MSIGTALREILMDGGDITTMVAGRIYPLRGAQGQLVPLITYMKMGATPNDSKDNVSEFDWVRVQLTLFHQDYEQCEVLASRVKEVMNRWRGPAGGLDIRTIVFEDERDGYDNEAQVQQINQVYKIWVQH